MTTEIGWEIPEPLSVCDVRLGDSTVATLRRHGNPDGPRLVLSHGNGLAIDLYYPFWSLLAGDFDLLVYDLRNHGWNAVGARRNHNVATLVSDGERILDTIDLHYGNKPKIGVFHSISAPVPLLSSSPGAGFHESTRSSPFSAQVLFDPPLCKPGRSQAAFTAGAQQAAAVIRRRAFRLETREQFADLLRHIPAFARVVPGVLELMARATLRKSTSGQDYELLCPREYEAQIMDHVSRLSPLVDFEAITCPTRVIGADPTLPCSYLPTLDCSNVMTVDYDFIPGATHFLQLEKPQECAASVREFPGSHRLS